MRALGHFKSYIILLIGIGGLVATCVPRTVHGQYSLYELYPGSTMRYTTPFLTHAKWIYFVAEDEQYGLELWRTNGGPPEFVHDLNPGARNGYDFANLNTVQFGDWRYYSAWDGDHGPSLWRTNGETYSFFADINPDTLTGGPVPLIVYKDQLYFGASDGVHGFELWRTDGETVEMVVDVNPGPGHGASTQAMVYKDWIYFSGNGGVHDYELWRTDGETAELVMNIADDTCTGDCGSPRSSPLFLAELQGWLYFSAFSRAYGRELWRTDGEVVELVEDINPGGCRSGCSYGNARPQRLGIFGEWMYFRAWGPGFELWRTNGQTTELVAANNQEFYTLFDEWLYYAVESPERERRGIWRVGPSGPERVFAETDEYGPHMVGPAGAWLYFMGTAEEDVGPGLWRTDGYHMERLFDLDNVALHAIGATEEFAVFRAKSKKSRAAFLFVLHLSKVGVQATSEVPVPHKLLDGPYPHPVQGRATLNVSPAWPQPVRVALYDLLGRPLQVLQDGHLSAGTTHRFDLDVTGLPPGVYVIEAAGDRFRKTQTVVVY